MKQQFNLDSRIDKAIFDYNLIEKNDKILIGASGGKDSTALIEYFSKRVKRPDCNFSYKALAIQNDFSPEFPKKIKELFLQWNVPFDVINVDVTGRIKQGQKMSCYWCSTQRRTELINYAIKNGFNKIALGHHMDDMLETLIMNMCEKGELSTMPPKLSYEKYPLTIIRPLCYITEDRIKKHAEEAGFAGFTCTCTYQENSARKSARKKIEMITQGMENQKERMFFSLKNIQKEYLP